MQSENPNISDPPGNGDQRAGSGPNPSDRGPYQRPPGQAANPRQTASTDTGADNPEPDSQTPGSHIPDGQNPGESDRSPADAPAQPIDVDAEQPVAEQDQLADLERRLAERTADLQRLQAEYLNYKKRVDRDRDVARRAGVERILADLMPVLDNIRRAGEHEEMSDGFKLVASEIDKLAAQHGLQPFGEAGDSFDPQIHDALMQTQADGITEPTAAQIFEVGYRVGDRVLRPARVAVAQPADDAGDASNQEG